MKESIAEDVVVFVDNVPGYDPELMRNHIRLKPYLNKKIDEFVIKNDLEKNSLGLHIRATDKKFHDTLDKLITKIISFTEKNKIQKIFLCMDNKEIEDKLKAFFTDKIIIYPKLRPDDNIPLHLWSQNMNSDQMKIQTAQEAILDMFILSRTEYVLSQLGSTFSEISRVYHTDKRKENYWQLFQYFGF